jgi:hypothetical protein
MKSLLLLLSLTLLLSCGRDPEIGPYEVCQLATYGNAMGDTATYTFDAENRAIECLRQNGFYWQKEVYNYNQRKLSEVIYTGNNVTGWQRRMVYTQEGNKIIGRAYDKFGSGEEKENWRTIQVLDKNGHRLRDEVYGIENGVATLYSKMEYETDTWGNITVAHVYRDWQPATTYTYWYDNKKNPELAMPESTLLKTNKNNITRVEYTGGNGSVVVNEYTYTYNAEGYPVADSDGRMYSYRCR